MRVTAKVRHRGPAQFRFIDGEGELMSDEHGAPATHFDHNDPTYPVNCQHSAQDWYRDDNGIHCSECEEGER